MRKLTVTSSKHSGPLFLSPNPANSAVYLTKESPLNEIYTLAQVLFPSNVTCASKLICIWVQQSLSICGGKKGTWKKYFRKEPLNHFMLSLSLVVKIIKAVCSQVQKLGELSFSFPPASLTPLGSWCLNGKGSRHL